MRVQNGVVIAVALSGLACFSMRTSKGGGQVSTTDAKQAARQSGNPYDIEVPPGYHVELVTEKLTFPTGIAFDERGNAYVTEAGYAYGERMTAPRIVRVDAAGKQHVMLAAKAGDQNNGAPWNGIAYHDGALFVAHGGELGGGKIVRYPITGETLGEPKTLVDKLPSIGDHHTNGPVIARDGWLYFGQGTATNSGVVGPDNADFGWLERHPTFHDVPCEDVTLAGLSFGGDKPTGAYQPHGQSAPAGTVIKGSVPCNGAIMRVRVDGGPVELVAWGFRNPFGLALDASDQLYVTDNGYDTRGSRPIFGAADMLWRVERGRWYGWPDYAEGRPLTATFYDEDKGDPKGFVLAKHPAKPPEPSIYFPVHSAATGLDFSRSAAFGHTGHGFVALFGDMAPKVGKVLHPVGFAVMKVNPQTGDLEYFARNRGDKPKPASNAENRGLERPVAARFTPDGTALYVVDFGVIRMTDAGPQPLEGSGKLWRITREERHAK